MELRLVSSIALPESAIPERLAGELLEGVSFAASPPLDAWLVVERRRIAGAVGGLLRERAQAELGADARTWI